MINPIRILLVDDSPYFLDAAQGFLNLQESLEVTGTVTEANNALAQALQMQPDIILLDLNLGERSGLELIPLFKKNMPEIKIIVLTIMEGESYRTAAFRAGADAFVRKTDMTNTLFSVIVELMNDATKDQDHFGKN